MKSILCLALAAAMIAVAWPDKNGGSPGACACAPCNCDPCKCSEPLPSLAEATLPELTPSSESEPKKVASIDPATGMAVGGPAVIQLTIEGCLPCIRWETEEKPKYLRQGWEVPAPVYGAAAPVYPSFRVYDGKRWHQHTGWMTGEDVKRILRESQRPASQSTSSFVKPARFSSGSNLQAEASGAAVVRVPAAAVASIGRDWTIGGRPWSRQSLINHLATHSSHGHSLSQLQGMSLGQLNALRNADHESQRAPMRSTVASSCPGGSCPPQSYSGRRGGGVFSLGLFGR